MDLEKNPKKEKGEKMEWKSFAAVFSLLIALLLSPLPPGARADETTCMSDYEDGAILDTVYEYEPLGDSWTPAPENMTYARYGATAITVPATAFPDCE